MGGLDPQSETFDIYPLPLTAANKTSRHLHPTEHHTHILPTIDQHRPASIEEDHFGVATGSKRMVTDRRQTTSATAAIMTRSVPWTYPQYQHLMKVDPQPRDPGSGYVVQSQALEPQPRDPGSGSVFMKAPSRPRPPKPVQPRDDGQSRMARGGPLPRDDGSNVCFSSKLGRLALKDVYPPRESGSRKRAARDPTPRDPGTTPFYICAKRRCCL